MDKYKSAVIEYNSARVEVRDLDLLRKQKLSDCKNLKKDDLHFLTQYGNCLVLAYKDTQRCREDYECYYDFGEILSVDESYENYTYCQNCIDAYATRIGPLADAKKRFGAAKRRISMLAKSASQEPIQPDNIKE